MQLEGGYLVVPGFLAGVIWYLLSHAPWVQAGVLQLMLDASFSGIMGACMLLTLHAHYAGKAGYLSCKVHLSFKAWVAAWVIRLVWLVEAIEEGSSS
jgi:hypothetical protein